MPPLMVGEAKLRAIVALDEKDKVRCQETGCGHGVYAAVHIVEDAGRLWILGSTCFAKRYGGPAALGGAQHGSGNGRRLTDEERALLVQRTDDLLARFQSEADAKALADASRVSAPVARPIANSGLPAWRTTSAPMRVTSSMGRPRNSPWSWQLTGSSIALLIAPEGDYWVRVQHHDGSQKLVPWPESDGWQDALPASVGQADRTLGVIAVPNIVEAIRVLKGIGFQGPYVEAWAQVLNRKR